MAALAVPGGFAFGAQRPAIQQEGPQVNCISQTQIPNVIRNEGQTEQIADYYFSCYNYGEATTATVSATISPTVAITSRTLDGALTEATLVIQDAAGFQPQQTILGTVSGNIVTFGNFTLPHSSNTSAYQPFNLTVTNIRVDATSLTAGTALTETVSVSGPTATPATFGAAQIAQVQSGLGTQSVTGKLNFPVCATVTAAAAAFTVQFAENSLAINAFKTQGGAKGNSVPGSWATNNTETGFAVNTETGLGNTADSGTRLRILFSNIPNNINLYVPVSVRTTQGLTISTPAGTMGLTATEAGAYAAVSGTTSVTGYTGTKALVQLTVVNGSAEAVYEILTDSATIGETYPVPVYLTSGGAVATQGAITAAVSFAPVGASSNIPSFAQLASTTTLSGSQFPTCETITNSTLTNAVLGAAYSQAVMVTGGITPYTWSLPTGNTLPAGLMLNASTGAITGAPTTPGPYSFTVQVADSSGQAKTQLYSVTVNAALVITNTTLPNGVLTVGYSQAVAVTGGVTPYTWSLPTGNTLPAGLALNPSTGAITGTPAAVGPNSFTVQVADSAAQVKTQLYSLTVNTALVISNTTLPAGVLTLSYSQAVAVTGGVTPYTWSLPTGNTLPSGLALNASTGAITGTPTTVGPSSFTIKVADTSGQTKTQLYNFMVDAAVTTTYAFRVPDATVGETYSTTLTATGGYGIYTWSLAGSESQLTGLTLSPGGVFSGTPTASGFYTSLTATVTDSSGATANNPINILINTALKITTTTLPVGVVGTAYPVTPAVPGGGSGGNVWSLAAGSLTGTGLSFSPQGVFSGTPLAAGPIGLTLKLTDQGSASATQPVTITVNPPLAIPTTTPLNTGVQGVFYSQQLPSTGGTGVNQWLLSDRGTLPSGITLGSSGVLSGLPGVNGTFTFTARVTDSYNDVVNQPLTWQVNPPVSFVTGATLPGTINGTSYAATLVATGGLGNYTFTPTTVIPFPLTFNNETGALSGSTNTAGTLTFSVKVTDSSGSNATQQFTILVSPSIYLNFASIVDGLLPLGYFRLETLSGTSEVNGYTYTASATGATVAQGVPNGITFNDSVKLDGASGDVTTSLIGGVYTAGSIMAWVQMSALPSVLNQIEYVAGESQNNNDFDLQFTTDNVLRFYSTSSNQNLSYTPALSNLLNQWHMIVATFDNTAGRRVLYWDGQPVASDIVQSVPNKTGSFEIGNSSVFGGRYFDGAIDEVAVWSFALSPSQIAQVYEEPNERLPNGLTTQTYGPFTVAAAGGSGSYTYTATGVPSGLTLSSAGVLTGQPTAAVNSAFLTVRATDTVTSQTSSLGFLISVSSPVIVTPATLSAAVVSVSYSKTLTATGGLGSGYQFTLANGSTLPSGMSLSLAGVLSGTPQVSGMTSFTVVATDSNGSSGQQSFSLTVDPAVTLTTSSTLPPAAVAVAYNQTLAAMGGLGSYTFSVANGSSLPSWLSLNTSTGALTGTPTGPAPYSFSLSVLDSSGSTATQTFYLTAYAPLTIAPSTLPIGVQNVYYSRTLTPSGGIRGYTFSLAQGSGTLPAGLQISSGGTISGVPTASGPSTFTVMVTDSASNVATQQYTLQINAALTISMTTLPAATQGAAYNQTLGATGGVGNYTWSIGLGTFTNAGLALNASTGALTGTPVTADTLTFGVQVSDGAGDTAFQTFNLFINLASPATYDFAVAGEGEVSGIQRISADGTRTAAICAGAPCHAQDIAADANGVIYTHDNQGIAKITPSGVVTQVLSFSGNPIFGDNAGTGGIALDGLGNIIFVDNSLDAVFRVASDGTGLMQVAAFPVASPEEQQDTYVALDHAGNYVVTSDDDDATKVYTFTPSGAVTTLGAFEERGTAGVAVDASGNVIFTDNWNSQIVKVDSTGALTVVAEVDCCSMVGLTLDPATGNFITGSYGGALLRITPAGAVTNIVNGSPLTLTSVTPIPLLTTGPLTVTPSSLSGGVVGQSYGPYTMSATGGSGFYTWSATGLPPGVTITPAGVVSGMLTASGNFSAQITATDSLTAQTGSANIGIIVMNAPLIITGGATVFNLALGTALNTTYTAAGGVMPYSWNWTGLLPPGLTLSSAGVLSGVITQAGNYSFRVQVNDIEPVSTAETVTVSVLGLTSTSLPGATATAPYSATVGATGGVGPYTFRGTGFPSGLAISGTGIVSGKTTLTGPFSVSITVTDSTDLSAVSSLSLTVSPSPVSVTTSSLPNPAVGIPYSQTLSASGGALPYTWTRIGGALPLGLSLSPAGTISGNPTQGGSVSLTVQATDNNGASGTANLTLTVYSPLNIVPTTLPSGAVGQNYGPITALAAGGSGTVTWSSTGLPAGVSLGATTGVISGRPTAGGPFNAMVTATDTVTGQTGSQSYTGNIAYAALTITSFGNIGAVPVGGLVSATFAATGGKPPYTWSSAGTPPAGVTLNAAGVLTGTVTQAGNYTFIAQVTDAQPVTTPLTVTGSALGITTTSLPAAAATALYSAPVTASGGATPYVFTGTGFPAGLSIISGTGVIAGRATVTGPASLSITVTDANQIASTSTLPLTVGPSPVSVSTSSLPSAAVGIPYSQSLTAAGGVSPYTWTMTGAALPSGLSLSSAGSVSGNPTAGGPFSFTAKATDSNGASGTATVSITVLRAVTITNPESLPSGAVGQSYGPVTVVGTGGSGTFTWLSTGLPAGVSIDASGGIVSGTPTAAGPYSATVTATDTVTGQTGSRNYSGSISYAALTITSSGNLGVTVLGSSLAATFAATGGKPPYTWAGMGTLPAGAALSATGALTGTATQAGNYTFTAQVTDAQPVTTPLTVTGSVLGIVTTSLPTATATTAYSATVIAAGGAAPYTFTGTGFPAGLSISAAGLITGTTAVTGPASVAITVTDANRISATAMLSLTVGAPLTISTIALPAATQGVAYSQTMGATGGTPPYTWGANGRLINVGLNLDPSTGVLTGSPYTVDTFTFTVQVTDSAAHSASQTFHLFINLPSPATYDFAVVNEGSNIERVSVDGSRTSSICAGAACHPRDIAADALGVIYAHDNQGIAKITPAGVVTQVLSFSGSPIFGDGNAGVGGIALDGLGNIVFVDNRLDAVFRVAADGTGLTKVAAFPVASPDELQDTYITVDHSGNYVVVSDDSGAAKLYSFTPSGTPTTLGTYPGRGTSGVAVDASGNVLFVDYLNQGIWSVDTSGNLTAIEQAFCCELVGLVIDPATGNYITADRSANQLLRFTYGGAITSILNGSPLTSPTSVTAIPLLNTNPLTVSPSSLSDGMVGQSYGPFTMSAAGGTGFNTWTATGLPPGVTIGAAGVVSGTPTASGSFTAQIMATDALTAQTGSVNIAISIAPILPLTITSGTTGFGTIPLGNPIATTYTAAGGLAPYNWNWTGSLPPGVTLTPAGVLSGTILQPGPYSFKVQVNDIEPVSTAATVTVSVLGLTTSSLPGAVATAPYSATIVAAGGATPYTFTGTGFPAGLSISSSGVITGTTTITGLASVALTVTDANKVASTSTLSLTVSPSPVSVSTSSLPNAAVGISYSQTLSASGGASPYTWTMNGGALPAGLGLSAGGLVSGNPTASGPFSFTAKATDNNGASGTATVSITVLKAVTITSPASLPAGAMGQTFGPVTVVGTGGSGTFTWSSTGLPAGLSIDAGSGIISGTPTAGGPYSATVTATDKVTGQTGSQTYSGSVSYAALTITSSGNLGVVPLGGSFAATFAATGGKPPYTWASTGTLPSGAALSATGALTGTATQAGNYTFTAQVTDAQPVTTPLTVTGSVLGLTTTSLPAATATVSYSATVSAAGGATPYTFAGTGFPAGLSISAAGAITGTTTVTGPASVTITVTDANKISATSALSLAVTTSPVTISTSSLPNAAAGIPYSQTLTASGGSQPYTWTLTNGALPAGLTFSTAGAIAGSPTASGSFSLTFKATDTNGASGTAMLSLTVAPIVTIVLPALPGGSISQVYGPIVVTATGGSGTTYTWTASGLPSGISIGPTTGSIGGTPAVSGSFSGTLTATDAITHQTAMQAFTFSVTGFPALSISSAASPAPVALGGAVSGTFTGSGGKPPYTWSSSGLPANVTLSPDGVLSGAPSQAGVFTASVTVTDSQPSSVSTGVTISVFGLTSASLPAGLVGQFYSAPVGATGGAPPYSFSATGLPSGLSLSAAGNLTGTVATPNTYNFTVKATDNGGLSVSAGFSLTIGKPQAISVSGGALADGAVNTPYSQSLSASGGVAPYTWALSAGVLPPGLSLSSSGTLSGIPTSPGPFSFGAMATDGAGAIATASVSLTVHAAPLVISTQNVPSGVNGLGYPQQVLGASGGVLPYVWTVTAGSLPTGITLSSAGLLAGTPISAGSFPVSVTATDKSGTTGTVNLALTIRPSTADLILSSGSLSFALMTPSTVTPPTQMVGVQSTRSDQQIQYTVSVSPAASWLTVTSGSTTPDTLQVAISAAALILTPGDYTTTIAVKCGTTGCAGNTQSISVDLTVTASPPRLQVQTDLLSFGAMTSSSQAMTQSIAIQNAGGGLLGIGGVSCEAAWCTAGSAPAFLPGGASGSIQVSINPALLTAGFFRTQVDIATSAGTASVPVTVLVSADSTMTLAPVGTQFSMQTGGAPGNASGSFLVSVTNVAAVSWSASLLSGSPWLTLTSATGASSASAPGAVNYAIDPAGAAALPAGVYYGQIGVSSSAIVNSPQTFEVVLIVSPVTVSVIPDPEPAGLLFITSVGGILPPQTVTVYSGSTVASGFQASATTTSGGAWLSVTPSIGSAGSGSPGVTSVTVNTAGLKQGVYTGGVSYSLSATAVRVVNVALIVTPPGTVTGSQISSGAAPRGVSPKDSGTCTPSVLVPLQTGLVNNFSAAVAWPTPLTVVLANDCGSLIKSGQLVATFSNGDPPLPLALADPSKGLYSGTWTPRKSVAQMTVIAHASAAGYPEAAVQVVGAATPNSAPVLTPHGTLHSFDPLIGAALAPGTIIQIYGQNLASQTAQPTTIPLPTTMNGTSVIIGGIPAPLYYVSAGQINAQLPFELTPGNQYQVLISANGALTTPDVVQLSAATPGLAAFADSTLIAQHGDGTLVSASAPAKPGEYLVAYLAGMGGTNATPVSGAASPGSPLALPSLPPVLTLNGGVYPIAFAGLTPGLVGLYQMNFQVPAGLPAGNLTLVVNQNGALSNQTVLPYTP